MFRPRVIPVLLLRNNGLVKTVKFDKYKYIGDPINAVRIFNDLEADELIFLDILASKEKRTISLDIVRAIGDEAYMPFAIGGGIRTVEDATRIISAGAEKVVLCSAAVERPALISEIAAAAGNQSVVVSIDFKKNIFGKYHVYSLSGGAKSSYDPVDFAIKAAELGAGELMIHGIQQDGTMMGYDLEIISKISQSVSIPVVACGGAGSMKDLKNAYDVGAHALAAGSIFVYHGPRNAVLVNYPGKEELINNFK
jgi:cyclase